MTGRSNEVEVKPKINCAKKKKSDGLTDRVDFFVTTVQKKKDEKLKVSIDGVSPTQSSTDCVDPILDLRGPNNTA